MSKYKLGDITIKNWNDWDRVPRDPVTIGAAILNAVGATTLAASTTAAFIVGVTAMVAVSAVAVSAFMPTLPNFDDLTSSAARSGSGGIIVNTKNATAPADFVYGKIRKGGVITYVDVSGTDNKILHQIIVLAAHEVDDIGDIYLNDEVVTINSSGEVTDNQWRLKNGDDGQPLATGTVGDPAIKIYKHKGNQTSASDDFDNVATDLAATLHTETDAGSAFVGKGLAYLYVRLRYDAATFANGVPLITAVVRGKKIVKTVSGTEQSAAYTNNAAWVIRDFLTSSYGLDDTNIDYTTFEAAADICDEGVEGYSSVPKYTINGVIRANEPIGNVLTQMVTSCGGILFWGSGSWRLKVGEWSEPTKTLELKDLRGPINLITKPSSREVNNKVRGTFIDEENDWISTDYPMQDGGGIFLANDGNYERILDLPLPYTTNQYAAQRLAKQALFRSREQLSLQVDVSLEAMDIEVGDFINFNVPRYNWDDSDPASTKSFEVVSWALTPKDNRELVITLGLRESSEAAFGFNQSDAITIVSNNSSGPRWYDVPTVGLSVSQEYREVNETVINVLVVGVTSSEYERIQYVHVRYKKTADSDFKSLGNMLLQGQGNNIGNFEIHNIEVPLSSEAAINYTVEVTPINHLGAVGTTQQTTYNVVADTTAPSPPTDFSHFLSGGTIFFTWSPVAAVDLSHYKLYHTANTAYTYPANAASMDVKIAKIARPATSATWGALAGKWFVTSVDKAGNESTTAATTTINASELPILGNTETDTENPSFSGTKTNLSVASNKLSMTTYSSAGSTGTYLFDHDAVGYMDVGSNKNVRVSSTADYVRSHANSSGGLMNWDDIPNNMDTWPANWDDWSDETASYGDVSVVVQVASSTDNSTYGSYVEASGEITGRYFKFRAVLSNSNPNVTPLISGLTSTVEY